MLIARMLQLLRPQYEVYTDGGCKNSLGSWSFVVVRKGKILHEASGSVRQSTSNEMEFFAVTQALQFFKKPSRITVCTDSRILIAKLHPDSVASAWPVLVEKIKQLSSRHVVHYVWVKAHSGNMFNERCDALCVAARTILQSP